MTFRIIVGDCREAIPDDLQADAVVTVSIITPSTKSGIGVMEISDMRAGKAGEYLVCADLLIQGYTAFVVEQVLSYDVLVDVDGRLVRLQVKTTRIPRPTLRDEHVPGYFFHVRRMGKGGRKAYADADADVFALVALDSKTIGYIPNSQARQTMVFRCRQFAGQYLNERMNARRDSILQMRSERKSYAEIGRDLGMDRSFVQRIAQSSPKVEGCYLDACTFESALGSLKELG